MIAKELLRISRLVFGSGHTLWITGRGKLIDIPSGSTTHYDYIAKNFGKLFPGEEYTDSNVFDMPMRYGWIHIRNHMSTLAITGDKRAIQRHRRELIDIIEERILDGDDFSVSIDYDDGEGHYKRGLYFKVPRELDELKQSL